MFPQKVELLLSLPKSFYFCLRSMPLGQAVKLPVIVSRKTAFRSLRGRVLLGKTPRFGMVRIGFGGSGTAWHLPCSIENNGTMQFDGTVRIGGGTQLCTVCESSTLRFGRGTVVTGESHIAAKKRIVIGADCAVSWDTQIMDTDFHTVVSDGQVVNPDEEIIIGDHVWICSRAAVLKGSVIPSHTIIALGAVISGKLSEENTCITGLPVRVLKHHCSWGPPGKE